MGSKSAKLKRCLHLHMDGTPRTPGYGVIYDTIIEKIGEIKDIIDDRC